MIDRRKVNKYIQNIKEITSLNVLYDVHVHPFEVIFGELDRFCSKDFGNACSSKKSNYNPPCTEALQISEENKSSSKQLDFCLRLKCSLLSFRRLYYHSCIRVFEDHMRLSGVDKVLMLPVLGPEESDEEKMEVICDAFGGNDRFYLAYCIPNNVANEAIESKLKEAIEKYNVCFIKIHPNITDINIGTITGIERIETILKSSKDNKIKILIHGGRSPVVKNEKTMAYSTLNNLEKIDWNITSEPVIIAHGAAFGHNANEIKNDILPKLIRMLDKYENLYVDLSGVNFADLCLMLKSLDLEKVVFGSDAFYEPQWKGLVRTFAALEKTSLNVEETFLKICSLTPSQFFPPKTAL